MIGEPVIKTSKSCRHSRPWGTFSLALHMHHLKWLGSVATAHNEKLIASIFPLLPEKQLIYSWSFPHLLRELATAETSQYSACQWHTHTHTLHSCYGHDVNLLDKRLTFLPTHSGKEHLIAITKVRSWGKKGLGQEEGYGTYPCYEKPEERLLITGITGLVGGKATQVRPILFFT